MPRSIYGLKKENRYGILQPFDDTLAWVRKAFRK